jgi:outer membrane lipoprotein-sorting protein
MKLFKKIALGLVLILGMNGQLSAQTVDGILDKYFEITGGKDKWKAVQSMISAGKAPTPQGEIPVVVSVKAPNKQRIDVTFQGKSLVQQAFNGVDAWSEATNPALKAEKLSPEQTKEIAEDAEVEDSFLDYASKGHKAELLGKKTIDGAECYEIMLTKKNGDVKFGYFDTEDNVLVMLKSKTKTPGGEVEIESYMSDYKEVDGLMIPFAMEQKVGGQSIFKMVFDSIKINQAVDDKIFDFPQQ